MKGHTIDPFMSIGSYLFDLHKKKKSSSINSLAVEVVLVHNNAVLILKKGLAAHLPVAVYMTSATIVSLVEHAIPRNLFYEKNYSDDWRILEVTEEGSLMRVSCGIVYPDTRHPFGLKDCNWVACKGSLKKLLGDAIRTKDGVRTLRAIKNAKDAGMLVWGTHTAQ